MKSFLHTAILMCLSCIIAAGTNAQAQVQVPPALRGAVLQNFPLSLFCEQESARQNGDLSVPTSEQQVQQGCIRAYLAELSEGGPKVAVVIYPDECPPEEMLSPSGEVRIFRESDEGWVLVPGDGVPSQDGMYVSLDGVRFRDLDGDGRKEIVLRYFYPKATGHGMPTYDIFAWQLTAEGIRPMIGPPDIGSFEADYHLSFPLGEPPECRQSMSSNLGSLLSAPSPIVFRDLDDDGKMELILGPDREDRTYPEEQFSGLVDITGYRIYALQNGMYVKVGETGVMGGWALPLEPEVVVAINPAAIPQEELLKAGERVDHPADTRARRAEEPRQAPIQLYCIAPDGYDPKKVDWSSLVVTGSDPPIRSLDDGYDHPAPYEVSITPHGWLATARAHQLLYFENTRKTHPDHFSMTTDDPVIMMGPGGRLHFTSVYRVLQFDRQEVLRWLADQWRAGHVDHSLKSCFTKEDRDWCYTPIGLPFEVRLTTSIGPYPITAHGVAMLWVRN